MSLQPLPQMLGEALEGDYAVPAFNVYDLHSAAAALAAARAERSPVILALGERYFDNISPRAMAMLLDGLLEDAEAPPAVGLHLDHANRPSSCEAAIAAGFSSVMIDASAQEIERNVAVTAAVVEVAHAAGVAVEAELGGLAAGLDTDEEGGEEATLTDPDQAVRFVAETGIDALAVSIGTVHGLYRGEPNIDHPRLGEIHSRLDLPLVLHGGSGTPAADLEAAIGNGIAKVNVNTEASLAAVGAIGALLAEQPRVHLSDLGMAGREAMVPVMREYIRRFGSGRA